MRHGACTISMLLALCAGAASAQTQVAGKPYSKLATRQETREAFLRNKVGGNDLAWGRWLMVGPFDHPDGAKNIEKPYPPEDLLPAMKAGDPDAGPKLNLPYVGQKAAQLKWAEPRVDPGVGGEGGSRAIDLAGGKPAPQKAVGYLYRRIDAPKALTIQVKLGSDDGVRVWLNGELLLSENAERPLDPSAHTLDLKLRPGANHLLVKVTQGAGEWQFALSADEELDPVLSAALDWQLDTDFPSPERRFFRVSTIPHPRDVSLEIGGVAMLDDGRPVVCTRRGDVFAVENAWETPATTAKFVRLASGLQEPLGLLAVKDAAGSWLYTAQRGELTRMSVQSPASAGGLLSQFQTACDAWQISGNYHEYAFGPKPGPDGKLWVTLNLAHWGGDGTVMGAPLPTRGWIVSIDPATGSLAKMGDGLRSPAGLGMIDGEMYYTDNQGDYVATNKLSRVLPGSFHGHQASVKFRDGYGKDWKKDGKPLPEITWPSVWFPYKKMGQSTTDILQDTTGGKFGPFAGQAFVGEQTIPAVYRVFLEKVDDGKGGAIVQGACFPFMEAFESGVLRLCWGPDGSMLVGMTDRGWGSTGPKRDGLQRVIWTGKTPMEILKMRARPTGFELDFTLDVDPACLDAAKFRLQSYTYDYHPDYGSDEVQKKDLSIAGVKLTGPRTIALTVDSLRDGGMGFVHELSCEGVYARSGNPGEPERLLHPRAYYTLQRIPK